MKKKQLLALFLALAMTGSSVIGGGAVFAKDSIYFEEGNQNAIVNGQTVPISEDDDAAPINIDGKVYIPIRFLSKLLGQNVYWEDGKIAIGDQSEEVLKDKMNEYYLENKFHEDQERDLTDLRKIKDSMKVGLYSADADPTAAIEAWQEDGSFSGIEYFNEDRNVWNANQHVEYLRTMVKAAYSEGNAYYGNQDLKDKIAKSLDFWVNGGRVECDNWWYQEIGIPNIVVDILILEPEEMDDKARSVLNSEAARGSIFSETISDRITERPVASTGGNLTDKLKTSFKIAVATENEDELYDIIHLLENELRVFEKVRTDEYGEDAEGIKADYSFHQHVDQVQFGGYGEVFVNGVCQLLGYVKGTKYMVCDNALNEFTNFILDGMQWTFRGEYRDFTTCGRTISRTNAAKGNRGCVINAVNVLEGLTQIKRYDELMELKENRLGETDKFTGNRHFWLSDYMAHKRDGYHVGLKIASNRTKLGEVVNNENLLGYYLSDGVTDIMQDGDEYDDVFTVWDWNKLPGTTTPQGGLKNLNDANEWNGEHLWNWKGNCSFVGGVSDGKYGAGVMDYYRDGMAAHKAWFFFDKEMVALGNSINSFNDMDIYTNLNQCVLDGEVKLVSQGSSQTAQAGTQQVKKDQAVLHNGIGYIFDQDAELVTEERTKARSEINTSYGDETVTKNVFQLGIHHGVKPDNASYEYRTVFNTNEEELQAYLKDNPVSVLYNDDKLQGVYHEDLKQAQIIVWKATTIELPSGLTISPNKKCALIIKELDDGTLEITAANPTNEPKALELTVNRTLPNANGVDIVDNQNGTTTLKYRLNEGIYGGSSTTYNEKTGYTEFKN